MCQLCAIEDIAKRDRWPKPIEHHKKEIGSLVTSVHNELQAAPSESKAKSEKGKSAASEELLINLRLLVTLLEQVDTDRQRWWSSPEKRDLRKRLDEEGDQEKLSALHKINNDVNERLESMNAKLGMFVKWNLGMNGGVWELMQADKVDATGVKKAK